MSKITNSKRKKKLFPKIDDATKLQIDEVGEYSISTPNEAKCITNIIKKRAKKAELDVNQLVITDGTAGVGGNTISFAKNFKSVNAIEMDETRFTYLKGNLAAYSLANVDFFQGDYISFVDVLEQDVIFLDPPWGGRDYKKLEKIRLKMSDVSMEDICNDILRRDLAEMIILKLPFNYDLDYLSNKVKGKVSIYSARRIKIVCIEKRASYKDMLEKGLTGPSGNDTNII